MGETVFHSELNQFCQKYLVKKANGPRLTVAEFTADERQVSSALFEQMLLFDTVSFKVHGENIPLTVLLNKFGVSGFESLLEQGAIKFVLWNQMVSYVVQDIPGLEPLQFGSYSSKAHCDPEESIELGLGWMKNQPKRSVKRNLIRKVRDIYSLPKPEISENAVSIVRSAYISGKLTPYGLGPESGKYSELGLSSRQLLSSCADEVLQYCHLLNEGMTTYDQMNFYRMFSDSGKKLNEGLKISKAFSELSELQDFPDLKALFSELDKPYEKLLSVRNKYRSKKFRTWLSEVSGNESIESLSREYIEAIANSKGFFQTRSGRFSKSIAMTTIGAGVGAIIAGPIGVAGGAALGRVLEPAADLGLDLIDEFIVSGLTKGWTPKMFFDDIQALRNTSN